MKRSRSDGQPSSSSEGTVKRTRFRQYVTGNKRKPDKVIARPSKHQKVASLAHSKAKQVFEQELLALETFVHTEINFATAPYPIIQRLKHRLSLLQQQVNTFPSYAERLQRLIVHIEAMRRASILTLKRLHV